MPHRPVPALLALSIALAGCVPQVVDSNPMPSVRPGQELTAAPGEVFFVHRAGRIETVREWSGLFTGWVQSDRPSANYVRKELVFSGFSGNVVNLSYSEYRAGMTAPDTVLTLRYDLTRARVISFQNFTIEITAASNRALRGRLLSDRPGPTARDRAAARPRGTD